MTLFKGTVATFAEHSGRCREPRRIAAEAIRLWPVTEAIEDILASCVIDDVVLTSHFVAIDVAKNRLLLDQSYTGIASLMPVRFQLLGDTFTLNSEPITSVGRHVVIGGPVDGNWYHWLFNWCPRMLLVKMLRPDLFAAPDVRFVVHPKAMVEPYRSILMSFGLDERRFRVVKPDRDYRLQQACLVSFLDQMKLYPGIMRLFARHLLDAFGVDPDGVHPGLFASRQTLPAPKRRIANFQDIEPVLDAFALDVVSLGTRTAAEQARAFHHARTIVGAHGSDLANLLFCRPGTAAIVIENDYSVASNRHVGLLKLAEMLEIDYRLLPAAAADDGPHLSAVQRTESDYIVDPDRLEALLRSVT